VQFTGEARELRDRLLEDVLVLQDQLDLDALAAAASTALDGEHGATV